MFFFRQNLIEHFSLKYLNWLQCDVSNAAINVIPEGGGGPPGLDWDFAQKTKFCVKVAHPWGIL